MMPKPTGRRKSTKPLIEIARAETKAEALEGLERWKGRHADVWPLLVIGLLAIPLGLAILRAGERYAKRHGKLKRSG